MSIDKNKIKLIPQGLQLMFLKDSILEYNFKGDWELFKVLKDFDKDEVFKQFIREYGSDNVQKFNTYINQDALLTYLIDNNYIQYLESDHVWNVHQSFGENHDMEQC